MSRLYGMFVEIRGHKPRRENRIFEAAKQEWRFVSTYDDKDEKGDAVFELDYAEGDLCGGETVEEFVDRLTQAIWKANGECCKVTVHSTFLENLPTETHIRGKKDIKRLKAG